MYELSFIHIKELNEHDFCRMVVHPQQRSSVLPSSSCSTVNRNQLINCSSHLNLRNTYSAVETLTVVIVVQCLNPSIAGFNGEAACEAFCGKKFIPVGFTIRFALLQEEWIVAEQFATISALEALRMEFSANGIQAISLNTKY